MHRILSQTLDLSAASQADMDHIQSDITAGWHSPRGQAIERLFDQICGPDEVLLIDRLEMDLGRIEGADWLDTFFARMAEATHSGIAKALEAGARHSENTFSTEAPKSAASGLRRAPPGQSASDAVLFYLQTGRLPWWSDLKVTPGWLEALLPSLPKTALPGLTKAAQQDPKVLERLIIHLPATVLAQHFCTPLPDSARKAVGALAQALALIAPPSQRHPAVVRFWSEVMDLSLTKSTSAFRLKVSRIWADLAVSMIKPSRSSKRVLGGLPDTLPAPWPTAISAALVQAEMQPPPTSNAGKVATSSLTPSDTEQKPKPGKQDANAQDEADSTTDPLTEAEVFDTTEQSSLPPSATTHARAPIATSKTDPAQEPRRQLSAAPVSDIPVSGAGLVLLHPFLNTLLEACDMTREHAFLSPQTQYQSAHLLGYLAYGRAEVEEAELTLAKLLAGLTLDDVLPPFPPNTSAQAAGDELLYAVITHWKVLGTSTPDWLREGFINREGVLSRTDQGWRLQIETRAQDVLLGQLPWGFSMISLPWMDHPLSVRWID